MVTGSCVCGRFAFEVDAVHTMAHCHCSFCRKLHGSAFATFASAPLAGFRWTKGDGGQAYYEASPGAKRAFCPDCGSKLPSPPFGDNVFVPMGLLDGDPGARPEMHFFVKSKAPWFEIRDGWPAYDTSPPGWEDPKLPTPPRPKLARADTIAGSCLCGAVSWESEGVPPRMGSCHCSRCRKVRAAAFSTQIFVPHAAFRWLSGKDQIQEFFLRGAQFFGNSFCRECASPVPRVYAQAPLVLIPAGGLDDDPSSRPMANIYVGSKAPWYEITDGLPQFAEMPPA